jgi:dTDP-4-dehydrorhamnose 3,5-epimerase-like enzyme
MPLNFKKTRIQNIEEVSVRIFGQDNDYLRTFEELKSQIKFENIFVVSSSANTQRGQHAHLRATQYLFCLAGLIEVEMLDGIHSTKRVLKPMGFGLRIPRGIWAIQNFKEDSMLMVISSEEYDESEYVRDFALFKKKKKIP